VRICNEENPFLVGDCDAFAALFGIGSLPLPRDSFIARRVATRSPATQVSASFARPRTITTTMVSITLPTCCVVCGSLARPTLCDLHLHAKQFEARLRQAGMILVAQFFSDWRRKTRPNSVRSENRKKHVLLGDRLLKGWCIIM